MPRAQRATHAILAGRQTPLAATAGREDERKRSEHMERSGCCSVGLALLPINAFVSASYSFNEKGTWGTHVMNKPLGFAAWFRQVGPERDDVAAIDPDFIFLKPSTAAVEGSGAALGCPEGPPPREVKKGVVVWQCGAQLRKETTSQKDLDTDTDMPITKYAKMTPAELRTWICRRSSGCTT